MSNKWERVLWTALQAAVGTVTVDTVTSAVSIPARWAFVIPGIAAVISWVKNTVKERANRV